MEIRNCSMSELIIEYFAIKHMEVYRQTPYRRLDILVSKLSSTNPSPLIPQYKEKGSIYWRQQVPDTCNFEEAAVE